MNESTTRVNVCRGVGVAGVMEIVEIVEPRKQRSRFCREDQWAGNQLKKSIPNLVYTLH